MCGIFAAFSQDRKLQDSIDYQRAIDVVTHRGPDFQAVFEGDSFFMGHTRLAIVGLEPESNQPFIFENLVMVYNGEIFNFVELKKELLELGYQFGTHSDTEVLIKAYHCWGYDAFEKLNGMWSLVIYNKNSKNIVVSRDRFGQKPLFYCFVDDVLYFASELQQLSNLNQGIDFELIQRFLKEGTYESDGRTFFRGIFEFPKAHYSKISDIQEIQTIRYWDYWGGDVSTVTELDSQEFEALLENAIEIRLRTDVPFGVLLSGGVDSTIVAAYAREKSGPDVDIPAFTYSSNDSRDETKYAEVAASRIGMTVTAREQEQVPLEYRARLRKLVRHLGRGHSSPAIVSVDYLYESISASGIKVALDGQGADELLAGYKTYFLEVIPNYIVTRRYADAWACIKDQFQFGVLRSILIWLRMFLPPSLKKVGRLLYGYERFFKRNIVTVPVQLFRANASGRRNANKLNRLLITQHDEGLENLIYYGDIVAMNNSVENRSPFMDHRLVDFAFSRDDTLKLKLAVDKCVLRGLPICEKFEDIFNRPKVGFSSDIKPATKEMMISELSSSPVLEWPIFRKTLKRFLGSGGFREYKYERLLFRLYQVHLWHDIYFCKV